MLQTQPTSRGENMAQVLYFESEIANLIVAWAEFSTLS
jgi:hypothetical protein